MMGHEVNLHLSGGVFFNLVLAARKPKSARQEICLKDLLSIYDRSARNLSGNSLKTIASRFRNCDPYMKSDYIMFGDAVTVDAFETRLRNDYDAVVKEVKDFSDKYLDLETNGRWLVRAFLELMEADDRIGEDVRLFIGHGNAPVIRRNIRGISKVNFYSFLLGVWRYICTHVSSGSGQETYSYLSDMVAEGKPRKLVKERIGFKSYEDVRIDYDAVTFSPDENMPENGEPTIGTAHAPHGAGAVNRFGKYLKNVKDKHGFKKSFFYEHRTPFYDFFVCNDIIRHGDRTAVPIKNISIDDFPDSHRCIILSGTGGQGKSMMMTHLLLDTIKHSDVTAKVPIFVAAKYYNPSKGDLMELILHELQRHDRELRMCCLTTLLHTGRAVVLIDGIDEVSKKYSCRLGKEIELLADSFPETRVIISTRPSVVFKPFENFVPYDLLKFDLNQSVEMVKKLDGSVVEPLIQNNFIEDLQCYKFGYNNHDKTKFYANPLLLSVMLKCYAEDNGEVTGRYHFFKRALDVISRRHDAAKSLTRELATGLDYMSFQNCFAEFCAITYLLGISDFDKFQLEEAFQDIIDINGLDTTYEAFIEDATSTFCLLYKNGHRYHFIHRYFQEFCAAYFISRQQGESQNEIRKLFLSENVQARDSGSIIIPMLHEMNRRVPETRRALISSFH